jgi:hypothetical protein
MLNVLPLVLDAFVQNLSVVGYRAASGQDAVGWDLWQRNQMDARQAEIYTDAVKYGVGYVVVTPGAVGRCSGRVRRGSWCVCMRIRRWIAGRSTRWRFGSTNPTRNPSVGAC